MTRAMLLAPLAALALFAASLHAAGEPAPAPAAPVFTPQATSSTTTLTVYLVLMVALLGGGAYLVRNGFTLFQPKMKGARKLQISETRMLGNRQFLIVAEYEDRKMLLGVCPGRIDYLATLGAAEPEFPDVAPEKRDE
jgi:flagellar protein FliO/FliZ